MDNNLTNIPETKLMTTQAWDSVKLFGGIYLLSSLGGIAALLRSKEPKLSTRLVVSAFINSGLIGLIIALLWYSKFGPADIPFLVGVSALAGFGGATTVDLIAQWLRNTFFPGISKDKKKD